MEVKSPGRISATIDRLDLEKVDTLEGHGSGVRVTIYYRNSYLENAPTQKAELFVARDSITNPDSGNPSISDYFFNIGVILGLEADKTLDWQMVKDIPDDYMAAHPECADPNNQTELFKAPGRLFWQTTGYQEE